MKGLYFDEKPQYRADLPKPARKADESLIRVNIAAICNTDKEVIKGYKSGFKGIMGHEFTGVVVESDNSDLLGKRVVCEINDNCEECLYCNTGRPHHCIKRRVPGLSHMDGCFAGFIAVPDKLLHVIPDDLPDEKAVFTEPLAAAVEVLEQNHLRPSQEVAIIGDGRLSFLIAQVLSLNGSGVTVFGKHEEKLSMFAPFAKTVLINENIDKISINGVPDTFETVIEASGSPSGMQTAFKLVRSCGLLILKSTYAGKIDIDLSEVVVRELTIKGSRCGPFEPALNLLKKGLITCPAITLFPVEEFKKAFEDTGFKAGFDFR
ncbi:MAG: alcohol dehydrogenase catalytic domain-containing protein [Lachnospiraceae bacterium]|nr:alcohol dehydrogenase catalytic domain-containing protein [Lachnospiraceae bacterium]